MKWMSTTKVHVSKGMMNMIVDYTRDDMVIAIAIEIESSPLSKKAIPMKMKKIFKEYTDATGR